MADDRLPDGSDRPRTAQESTIQAAKKDSTAAASIPPMLQPPETRGTSSIGRAVWLLQVSTGRWDPSTPVPNFDPTPNETSGDVSLPDDAESPLANPSDATPLDGDLPEDPSETSKPADGENTAIPWSIAALPILQRAPSQTSNVELRLEMGTDARIEVTGASPGARRSRTSDSTAVSTPATDGATPDVESAGDNPSPTIAEKLEQVEPAQRRPALMPKGVSAESLISPQPGGGASIFAPGRTAQSDALTTSPAAKPINDLLNRPRSPFEMPASDPHPAPRRGQASALTSISRRQPIISTSVSDVPTLVSANGFPPVGESPPAKSPFRTPPALIIEPLPGGDKLLSDVRGVMETFRAEVQQMVRDEIEAHGDGPRLHGMGALY